MANVNSPFGFEPIGSLTGAAWSGKSNVYYIPSTDGNIMSKGDAVICAAGGDANGVPAITKAVGTAGAGGALPVRGVILGFMLSNPNNTSLQGTILDNTIINIPATKTRDYYALVADDPNTMFLIQGDATATNQVAAACNLNTIFTVTNPTSPSMRSASVLTSASIATTNTLNLRIMGLYQSADNAYGAYARWVVKFNLHDLAVGATGV